MAWLKLEDTFCEHPKFRKLARKLKISEVQARGHMCTLWVWTLRYAPDGNLSEFDHEDLAIASDWDGDPEEFINALLKVKLLDSDDNSLHIHDWMERAGSFMEKVRKRKQRQQDHIDTVSQDNPGQSRNVPRKIRLDKTRLDKTRTDTDKTKKLSVSESQVEEVLSHFQRFNPNYRVPTHPEAEEVMLVRDRVSEGYTTDQLKTALFGMQNDPWEQRERFNSPRHCFKSSESVSKFIDLANPDKLTGRAAARERTLQKFLKTPIPLKIIGDAT